MQAQAARDSSPVGLFSYLEFSSLLTYNLSVLNTFKSMIVDDDVLEKEDLYILDRMKEFISTDGVSNFAAAKQLLILIERTVCTFSLFVA